MDSKSLASIDIGTNTFRLLIASVRFNPGNRNYSINEIYSERIITRLGEGIHENGLLREDAMSRGITALRKFSGIISHRNILRTSAVATSALREAGNSDMFIREAKDAAGIDIKIITGEEEARITSAGMLIDITPPETALMVDIGGGSTELIFYSHGKLLNALSLNLGVVYLAGKYMKNDPPRYADLVKMSDEVSEIIMSKSPSFAQQIHDDTVFIGTAGTITSLAAMSQRLSSFDHSRIHNFNLSRDNVRSIFSTLSVLTLKQREKHIPFELARLDIIVPGTLILLKLMEIFSFSEITVSNYGLREGILIELYHSDGGNQG